MPARTRASDPGRAVISSKVGGVERVEAHLRGGVEGSDLARLLLPHQRAVGEQMQLEAELARPPRDRQPVAAQEQLATREGHDQSAQRRELLEQLEDPFRAEPIGRAEIRDVAVLAAEVAVVRQLEHHLDRHRPARRLGVDLLQAAHAAALPRITCSTAAVGRKPSSWMGTSATRLASSAKAGAAAAAPTAGQRTSR